jgi:hypothetical protein
LSQLQGLAATTLVRIFSEEAEGGKFSQLLPQRLFGLQHMTIELHHEPDQEWKAGSLSCKARGNVYPLQ